MECYVAVCGEVTLLCHLNSPLYSVLTTLYFVLTTLYSLQRNRKVIAYPDSVLRQVVQYTRYFVLTTLYSVLTTLYSVLCTSSYYLRGGYFVLTELVFDVKLSNAIYLIAEEVQSVRHVVAVTVYIHYSSSYGVLSWFEDEVHAFEAYF